MAGAGERIANSPEIRSYMDAMTAAMTDIDRIRDQIAQTNTNIEWAQTLRTNLESEFAIQNDKYAAMLQGLIDTGSSAASIVGNQLAAECARKSNDILQQIATANSQIDSLTASIAKAEAAIAGKRATIEEILGQQISAVQAIMNGGRAAPYKRAPRR